MRSQSPPPLPPKEAPSQPPPLPPQPGHVVIRKDYNPKATRTTQQAAEQYLISPITGEKIPADKMQEHMRISLLDPSWVAQRDKAVQEKMTQEEVYAPGSAVLSSLIQFAERRSDIFGLGVEETAIGKKIGEEEKKRREKVTWDGHTASVEAATRAAGANITIEEQIQQIHKIKGLLPDDEKERIGPSKPLESGMPISDAPISSTKSAVTSSAPTTSASAPVLPPPPSTSTTNITIAPPKSQPASPVPPVPPPVGTMIPPWPLMPPPQGLILAPPGPPPPHLLAMAPQPPMAPVLGPPGAFVTSIHSMPPPPPTSSVMGKTSASHPSEGEPAAKKAKAEASLLSEEEFLKKNKSPVSFHVQVPSLSEKPEWKLNGQMLNVTLPLTDMVSVIKVKIHEVTSLPPGKQKLQFDGMFIKDSNSLAFYNITSSSVVSLRLKERGGRKK